MARAVKPGAANPVVVRIGTTRVKTAPSTTKAPNTAVYSAFRSCGDVVDAGRTVMSLNLDGFGLYVPAENVFVANTSHAVLVGTLGVNVNLKTGPVTVAVKLRDVNANGDAGVGGDVITASPALNRFRFKRRNAVFPDIVTECPRRSNVLISNAFQARRSSFVRTEFHCPLSEPKLPR